MTTAVTVATPAVKPREQLRYSRGEGKRQGRRRQCDGGRAACTHTMLNTLTTLSLLTPGAGGNAAAAAQHGMTQHRHATPCCARLASATHHPPRTQIRPHAGTAAEGAAGGRTAQGSTGAQHRRRRHQRPAAADVRTDDPTCPGRDAGRARLCVLKHGGGACRAISLPGRCERGAPAVNATCKCRFFGTCLSERNTYHFTQKCLLSAMVCVAQKALVFLYKCPPTWDPSVNTSLVWCEYTLPRGVFCVAPLIMMPEGP